MPNFNFYRITFPLHFPLPYFPLHFTVLLVLASSSSVRAADQEVYVDSIYFPDDKAAIKISKRQVANILNLVYHKQDRIVDNRHTVANQRQQQQQQQQQINQLPSAPNRQPIQTSPANLQSQLYNYDPVTDFAWNTFKVRGSGKLLYRFTL